MNRRDSGTARYTSPFSTSYFGLAPPQSDLSTGQRVSLVFGRLRRWSWLGWSSTFRSLLAMRVMRGSTMGVPVRGRGNKKEPGPGKQIPMLLWPFVGTQRTSCCRRASMRRCEAWGLERLLPFGRVKPCASKLRSHCSLVFWCDRRYMSSVKRFSPKTSSLRTPKPKLNVPGFPKTRHL